MAPVTRRRRAKEPVSDVVDDDNDDDDVKILRNHRSRTGASSPAPSTFWLMVRLGRPKFLIYSMACHVVGLLIARQQQGRQIDWAIFLWLQLCVWTAHLMTHYVNDYADREVDSLNRNAGAWTGGSRVLVQGLLKPGVAKLLSGLCLGLTLVFGSLTVLRFTLMRRHLVSLSSSSAPAITDVPTFFSVDSVWEAPRVLQTAPWDFVLVGVSVLVVAAAYSLSPFRLSARGLGELCVSYVLTFACPAVGCLAQGGRLTWDLVAVLSPLFVVNAARMLVMNIPDRAGDAAGGKITSVVMVGEAGVVRLHNALTAWCFGWLVPAILPLTRAVRVAYLAPLPVRWWLSLQLNQDQWWHERQATDLLPFYESLYVLLTASSLAIGLLYS